MNFLKLLVLATSTAVASGPTVERYDLLSAINTGDRAAVAKYCAEDVSLDVSRTICEKDTAVHAAIRALIADYEKHADHDKLLNNLGVWTFAGISTTALAHYFWPSIWGQLSQSKDLVLGAADVGQAAKNVGSLSTNVLMLAAFGGLVYWSLKNIYKDSTHWYRTRNQAKQAAERLKIVELLMAHQSFKPATANTDGQTPLALIQAEREHVTEGSVLDHVLQSLEVRLLKPLHA